MKQILLLILFTATFSSGKSSFGLKLGPNVAQYQMDFEYVFDYTAGFQGLLFAEYNLNKYFSPGIELGYAQFGFDESTPLLNTTGSKSRNNYLQYLTAQLNFKFGYPTKTTKPYGIIGFAYGYALSVHIESYYPTGSKLVFYPFQDSNLAIVFGIGSELIRQKRFPLLVESRFKYDLNPVFEDASSSMKSRYIIELLVGFVLKKGWDKK